jgi:hypothetical protein
MINTNHTSIIHIQILSTFTELKQYVETESCVCARSQYTLLLNNVVNKFVRVNAWHFVDMVTLNNATSQLS